MVGSVNHSFSGLQFCTSSSRKIYTACGTCSFRCKKAFNSGPAIDATDSFITLYSFSCMALRRWELSTLIAAFLPGGNQP
jgi:hypothetical protein